MNDAEEMLSGMGVGFTTERDRLRAASLLTGLLRDKECLDWLEENARAVSIGVWLDDTGEWREDVDRPKDIRVVLEYVSKESGKPVTVCGRTLRDVAAEGLRD